MACSFAAVCSSPGLFFGLEVARIPPVGIPEPVSATQGLGPPCSPSRERRQGSFPPAERLLYALGVAEQLALPAVSRVDRSLLLKR